MPPMTLMESRDPTTPIAPGTPIAPIASMAQDRLLLL